MNEDTGTYNRGLRNGAAANRRFYEPGASPVDAPPKQSNRRKISSILLAVVLCFALLGYLTTLLCTAPPDYGLSGKYASRPLARGVASEYAAPPPPSDPALPPTETPR